MTITYRTALPQSVYTEVDYNTAGIDSGLLLGSIPVGCKIVYFAVAIQTAFNANGAVAANNLLTVGFAPTSFEYATAAETLCATTGVKHPLTAYNNNPLSAVRSVYVRYVQSGTAASAGKAHVILNWIP